MNHHHPLNDENMVAYLRGKCDGQARTITALRNELRAIRGLMLKEFRDDPEKTTLACTSQTLLHYHAEIRTMQTELDSCHRKV